MSLFKFNGQVTCHETSIRLKDGGFKQFVDTSHSVYYNLEGEIEIDPISAKNLFFAPSAIDILNDLHGWALTSTDRGWICYYLPDGLTGFHGHENPAEACAMAWFFEQAHDKNK